MKVLVCGSRDWMDEDIIRAQLEKLPRGSTLIHGAARGADSIAENVAMDLGFNVRAYKANWDMHAKAAGPIRNSQMLTEENIPSEPIDLVLAFTADITTSKGTADMVKKSKKAGLHYRIIGTDGATEEEGG